MECSSDRRDKSGEKKRKGPLTEEERYQQTQRAIWAMERLLGKSVESREMITFGGTNVISGPNQPSTPYTHMLSAASSSTIMTMRRFEDLYNGPICRLSVDRNARQECLWLFHESRSRELRAIADGIVAHDGDKKKKVPFSPKQVDELNKRSRWESSQQLGEWLDQAIPKMQAVLDKLKASLVRRG
jgi:hypothetical protein